MSDAPLSLQDLVRHAVGHLRCQWPADATANVQPDWSRWSRSEFEHALAQVLDAVEQGNFRGARQKAADLGSAYWRGVFPPEESFLDACELAERIDCFLALLSTGVAAALARSCREDLNVLAVLADWFAENNRPTAAEEARHLLSLVRLQPRDPIHFSGSRPPHWWERYEDRGEEEEFEEGEIE
jgi:hypothetical protein